MNRFHAALSVVLILLATMVSFAFPQGAKPAGGDVAAITDLLNSQVKADLANDSAFYQKNLADDWTGGSSRGTWDTKQSLLADMKDTKNNNTSSQSFSDIKVRVHGDTAIATYKSTYDSMIRGQRFARTIICTDTFQRQAGGWKVIADHCSQAAK